jgi:cystathionine gamma-synthase
MHAVTSNTKAIIVESPSSILMKVTDLSKLSSFSKELGILLIVDNSQMTFYLQCPIDLGADVVLYSSSAQLSTDLSISAGFVVTDQDMLEAQIRMIQKKDVTTHSPHDCQTILKDIKALPLRMDIQQENAIELAGWLKSHPKISEVNYIGLPEHPGYILSKYQASGFGGMLSFCVQSEKVVEQLMQRLRTISIVDHFDGMDFLLYQIASRDRTGVPEVQWNKGIDDSLLVKLFVGTEKIDDLILDFEQALEG